jgi:hypothetical protein
MISAMALGPVQLLVIGFDEPRFEGDIAAGPDDLWSATEAIPPGGAAAVALLEHRWAIPLRDAIRAAGGVPVADAWLAPEDLASIGLPAG